MFYACEEIVYGHLKWQRTKALLKSIGEMSKVQSVCFKGLLNQKIPLHTHKNGLVKQEYSLSNNCEKWL